MTATPYGFRIVGGCDEERRLVDHDAASLAYAACDERADVNREAYLSAFVFGEDFRNHLEATGSVRGFVGPCWSRWIWFDLDAADLDAATLDARRLAAGLVERYRIDGDSLLIFFSGQKGYHVGLPASLWMPPPSTDFHRVCKKLAEGLAAAAEVKIDTGVYDKVRPFRAPNSRHPKTGLHKRRLSFDELMGLSVDRIRDLAAKPATFDIPSPAATCERAVRDWTAAAELVGGASEAKGTRRSGGTSKLSRLTLEFIRGGASEGDRHRLLYSAARNLAEFGCPIDLAYALLSEAAFDSGLSPKDVRRQVECGINDQPPITTDRPTTTGTTAATTAVVDLQAQLASLWTSTPDAKPAPAAKTDLPGEPPPELRGDGWEHPKDRLGVADPSAFEFPFGMNVGGPYGKEGGRR